MITDEAKRVEAQAYAESVREEVRRKHNAEDAITHQRAEMDVSAVTIGERVDISPNADAIPDGVARLADMVSRYAVDLNQYVNVIDEFERAIRRFWPQYEQVLVRYPRSCAPVTHCTRRACVAWISMLVFLSMILCCK